MDDKVGITMCPRCKGAHVLPTKKFTSPLIDANGIMWTHWSTCPTTGDPILIQFHIRLVDTAYSEFHRM